MMQVEGLRKVHLRRKGPQVVFDGLSFRFPEAGATALLGRNGAGKSTLLRLLARIDRPDAGRVRVDRRLSWPVGPQGSLQSALNGQDHVAFLARLHGLDAASSRAMAAFVEDFAGLGRQFTVPARLLPPGLRVKLGLALVLALPFEGYLIDEVGAAGDAAFRAHAQALLRQRLQQGATALIVSHNMNEVRALCDAVIVLDRGQLTLHRTVEEGIAAYLSLPPAAPAFIPPEAPEPSDELPELI